MRSAAATSLHKHQFTFNTPTTSQRCGIPRHFPHFVDSSKINLDKFWCSQDAYYNYKPVVEVSAVATSFGNLVQLLLV